MSVNESDPHPARTGRRAGTISALIPTISVALSLGLVVGLVLVGLTRTTGDHHSAAHAVAAAEQVADDTGSVSLDVELGDMYIKPSSIDVPAGKKVVLRIKNAGQQQHTLALRGENPTVVDPGQSATAEWGAFTESAEAWCTVPGHKDAGMLLKINVQDGGGTSTHQHTGDTAAAAPADSGAKIDPAAKPGPDWKPVDPTLPPADNKTVHEVTFRVKEQATEVAPGVKQLLWTYNGTAPGPVLHGKVGDTFRVTLINDGTINHSIDFHASKVAPDVQMRQLKPGESLVYEFKASYAGIFTYHCGADPMIYHMGNGMVGAVVIDPPSLPKVDTEIVLVQTELNLGPNGQVSDLKKMMGGTNHAVVFNGYYNQYAHAPIKVKPGARIRAWVDNAAINEDLAFHTVGSIFDTVWKEGAYLLQPGNAHRGGSQTLDLQPTQAGFVEFTLDEPGTYPFVNHKMMNLSRGALGLFLVGDGVPSGGHG